jgi:hypothetical protein
MIAAAIVILLLVVLVATESDRHDGPPSDNH